MQLSVLMLALALPQAVAAADETPQRPKSEVPADHLAYFDLRGPVCEVTEYALYDYSKAVWKFDIQGRLTEYLRYGHPFVGGGGCVFRLMAHYRYAYDKEGRIMFLYTYDEEYNLMDEYDDEVLELFPPGVTAEKVGEEAEQLGDSTYCRSNWASGNYAACRYDRHHNWTERVEAADGEAGNARIAVREIRYYTDAELLGLRNGVKKVTCRTEKDGAVWSSEYSLDRDGRLTRFQSYRDQEPLYEWTLDSTDCTGQDLIVPVTDQAVSRTIEWWNE